MGTYGISGRKDRVVARLEDREERSGVGGRNRRESRQAVGDKSEHRSASRSRIGAQQQLDVLTWQPGEHQGDQRRRK